MNAYQVETNSSGRYIIGADSVRRMEQCTPGEVVEFTLLTGSEVVAGGKGDIYKLDLLIGPTKLSPLSQKNFFVKGTSMSDAIERVIDSLDTDAKLVRAYSGVKYTDAQDLLTQR